MELMLCEYKCPDVGDYSVQTVKKIRAFGAVCFTSQNEGPQDIQGRIETANRAYFPIFQLTLLGNTPFIFFRAQMSCMVVKRKV
jgi:hypothetical protein